MRRRRRRGPSTTERREGRGGATVAVRTAAAAAVIVVVAVGVVEVVRAMMVGCRRGRSPDHQQSHGDGIPGNKISEGHFPSENGQRGGRPPLSPLGPTCVRAIDKDSFRASKPSFFAARADRIARLTARTTNEGGGHHSIRGGAMARRAARAGSRCGLGARDVQIRDKRSMVGSYLPASRQPRHLGPRCRARRGRRREETRYIRKWLAFIEGRGRRVLSTFASA